MAFPHKSLNRPAGQQLRLAHSLNCVSKRPLMDLEDEIRTELERLEQIFNEESQIESSGQKFKEKPNRLSYSAYEYAEAEGEKEELEDKFNQLLTKSEEWNAQIEYVSRQNADLQAHNSQLVSDNVLLRQKLGMSETSQPTVPTLSVLAPDTESKSGSIGDSAVPAYECYGALSQGSIALELLLAETRAKLLRMEAAYHDMVLLKDAALQELEGERAMRVHAEKERDAFSAAYEASLQHFEKWSRTKT
jgi:DNA repair exonuclease SbcCD ATPase subunit